MLTGRVLGIYLAFLIYFGGVFAVIWYGVPTRSDFSIPTFPLILLSAGIIGLLVFSYLSIQWRKQTRMTSLPRVGTLSSITPTKDEPFRGFMKTGSFVAGFALLVFGFVEFFYGLLLYGQKSDGYQTAAYFGRPYDGPYAGFLTYIPEVVVVSAICVFILGLWMLVHSRSEPADQR